MTAVQWMIEGLIGNKAGEKRKALQASTDDYATLLAEAKKQGEARAGADEVLRKKYRRKFQMQRKRLEGLRARAQTWEELYVVPMEEKVKAERTANAKREEMESDTRDFPLIGLQKGMKKMRCRIRSQEGKECITRILPDGRIRITVYRGAKILTELVVKPKPKVTPNLSDPLSVGERLPLPSASFMLTALGG